MPEGFNRASIFPVQWIPAQLPAGMTTCQERRRLFEVYFRTKNPKKPGERLLSRFVLIFSKVFLIIVKYWLIIYILLRSSAGC